VVEESKKMVAPLEIAREVWQFGMDIDEYHFYIRQICCKDYHRFGSWELQDDGPSKRTCQDCDHTATYRPPTSRISVE
jgi:hypothetical protein